MFWWRKVERGTMTYAEYERLCTIRRRIILMLVQLVCCVAASLATLKWVGII